MLPQLVLNGFVLGAIIALMSVGFTLIFSLQRVVNFWHGEAYMFGAVIVYLLFNEGVNYWGALIIAMIAVGALGWLTERLVFRRFHGNLIGGYIAAVALSLLFQNGMWYMFGPVPHSIKTVAPGIVEIFGATVSKERLLIVVISIGTILALSWFIKNTKMGKTVRSVEQDREAALVQGINVNRVYGITFAIATALAALAGGLMAPVLEITPIMGIRPLILTFIVVIVGGMGSVMGALIASFIIGFLQSFVMAFWGPQFPMAVSFGVALVILIVRPRGLMGHD